MAPNRRHRHVEDRRPAEKRGGDRKLRGEGEATVKATAQQVWDMLLDPNTLAAVIPGCHGVEKISDTHFRADVTLGIGPVKGRYRAEVKLSDLDPPNAVTLAGSAEGALGFGNGEGRITLRPLPDGGTAIHYAYEAGIGGKVASIGGRLLGWRGAGHHRAILCGAGAQGWRRFRRLDRAVACLREVPAMVRRAAMKPAAVRLCSRRTSRRSARWACAARAAMRASSPADSR